MVRTSEGKYLEVLQPGALVNLPIEIDVYDGGNPGTMLATLEAAFDASLQVELNEVGSGRFSILRSDEKATPAILARGNLIKVKTGGKYRGAWWVEEPSEVLTSTREASGEVHTVQGRGALAVLERAVVYPPVWPTQPGAYRSASHAYNGASGATTLTCAKPSGIANGDALIAAVSFVGGSTKTVSPPPGWREFRRVNYGTTLGVTFYVKQAGSSEPATYKWAFSNVTVASANIVALYNVSLDFTTYGFASATQGSGTAIKHPSLNVDLVDGVLLTFAGANAGTGMTAPVGYTEATDDAQGGARLQSSYLAGPALGDTGDVFTTNSASGAWVGVHLLIPNSASNDATFAGETPGAILGTLIDRAQARGGIVDVTYDFTGTADSQGQPWADTFDLSFHVGTSLLDVWRHLVGLGMEGEMSPDLKLSAYVDRSRDRTGDVIFRKGYHFLGDVANNYHYAGLRTRFLVEGSGGRVIEVTNPVLEADPLIGRREGFLNMGTSDTATDLSRAGTQALTTTELQDRSRTIPIAHGLLSDGLYEPWEDYRPGDWVGLDPAGDGIASTERVVAVTIAHRDVLDYTVTLDLNSVTLEALVKLQRQVASIGGSSSPSGGGAGASLGLGSTPSGSTGAGGTVAVQAGDTPGFLYDKVDVSAKLVKTLGGVTGNRTVALDLGAIALDELSDVNAPGPSAGQLLQWSGSEWVAGGSAGGPTDRIWTPRAGYSALSDEFIGSSLDPSWSRVDVPSSSHLTWTQEAGVLSAKHDGADAAVAFHGLVKSLGGMTFPVTIETACRWNTPYAYAHLMLGPVFTDSAGVSGTQLMLMPYTSNDLATAVYVSLRRLTSWQSQQQDYASLTFQGFGAIALFFRIRWTAANTFTAEYSVDGVSWLAKAAHVNVSASFTPTHVGLLFSTWGQPSGQQVVGGTYEFFRVYNS